MLLYFFACPPRPHILLLNSLYVLHVLIYYSWILCMSSTSSYITPELYFQFRKRGNVTRHYTGFRSIRGRRLFFLFTKFHIWTAIYRLTAISDLSNKIERQFFQIVAVSVLLYGCTTWTLTKRLEKKARLELHKNCGMLFWTNSGSRSLKKSSYRQLTFHRIGWGCRRHRLRLCRGVKPTQWVSWIWH